jgi:hypothetical protein
MKIILKILKFWFRLVPRSQVSLRNAVLSASQTVLTATRSRTHSHAARGSEKYEDTDIHIKYFRTSNKYFRASNALLTFLY